MSRRKKTLNLCVRHRDKHGDLFDKVARILFKHDPERLAAEGAPADEYQPEAAAILDRMHLAKSEDEAAAIIADVFNQMFGHSHSAWRVSDLFAAEADEIWKAWQLLPSR